MNANLPFLVFVHVEKAGGISMHAMLHHYLKGYISPHPAYGPHFTKADLSAIQRVYPLPIKGVGGHRVMAQEDYNANQFVFSFVREPIARLISHLNWQIHQMKLSRSFEAFIENEYFQNFQTFRLTGARDYATAKSIIDARFDFIGLVEQYDLSVNILSQKVFGEVGKLNFEKMNTTEQANRSFYESDLSEAQLKKIQQLNQLDIDIYNYLTECFEQRNSTDNLATHEPSNLVLPITSKIKRKISNRYLKYIQSSFMNKVEYGY